MGKHRKPAQGSGTTVRLVVLSIGLMVPGAFGVASASTTHGLVGNLRCLIVDGSCSAVARPERHAQVARSPVPGAAAPRRPAAPVGTPEQVGATTAPAGRAHAITFVPYVDMDAWPPVDLAEVAERTGVRRFTVGFVSAGQGCSAAWGGAVPLNARLDGDLVGQRLDRLRDRAGRAVVSLTGPEGTDLATQCTKVDDLTRQYRAALDVADSAELDVFVPAGEAVDATAIERRSKALAQLQWERRDVRVSLTLPLTSAGLPAEALGVLTSAAASELDVSHVNLFAGGLPGSRDGAGRALVQAVTRAHAQLRGIYPGESDARLWARIGVTPVIGAGESGTFGLADARLLRDWARAKRIGRLSMWSVTRDAACDIAADPARNGCSGVAQRRGEFMEILRST